MITLDEILCGTKWTDLIEDVRSHLFALHHKSNVLRFHWKKPMVVTSGHRTWAKHVQTYVDINVRRSKNRQKPLAMPEHSWHLVGAALDVADPDGELMAWLIKNEHLLDMLDLYVEKDTDGWCRWQLYAPPSGNRFFYPKIG